MIPDGWIMGIMLFGGAFIMSLFYEKIKIGHLELESQSK